jgi:5-methylcytosine-specific restriction endonuclease McrA
MLLMTHFFNVLFVSLQSFLLLVSKISQAIRIVCWNTYIGEEIGKTSCLCCKTNYITQHNFHCGHVVAEANGGKVHVENLRPICAVCNNSMGTMDMQEFALENFNVHI